MAGYAGTITHTTDGGNTWEQLYLAPDFSNGAIRALAFLPGITGHILAGAESAGGILRSTDNAATWTRSVTGLDASNIYFLMTPEQGGETVIAGKGKAAALSKWSEADQSWADMDSL